MTKNQETERLRAQLHDAGLRLTRPRLLVYSLLRRMGGHRSVDELAGLLRELGDAVPRTSVYNVVGDLLRAGLVMCAEVGPGRALYEASDTWHHHFVCRRCGSVTDVPCLVGKKPCLAPPPSIVGTIDEAQVTFRGVCEGCAAGSSEARA